MMDELSGARFKAQLGFAQPNLRARPSGQDEFYDKICSTYPIRCPPPT